MSVLDTSEPHRSAPVDLNPLSWRRRWLSLDENPAALAFAQTLAGQMLLHAAFLGLVFMMPLVRTKHFALIAVALIAVALVPTRRMLAVSAVGAAYFLLRPLKMGEHYVFFDAMWAGFGIPMTSFIGYVGFGLVFMVFTLMLLKNQRSRRVAFAANRPILTMFFVTVVLSAATVLVPQGTALFNASWIALGYVSGSFFLLGYVLLDNRAREPLPQSQQLGFLRPVWTDGPIPIKGPGYLQKFEAKDGEALARTRIKALKLMVWATILFWFWELAFNRGIYGALGVPTLETAISANADGEAMALPVLWGVLGIAFLAKLINFGASVHTLVAVVRMAGFQIPRGMNKPLASRTISEFWGRYLFYFKEILADFFFYPAFQRYFKRSPRLRMAFATFCAAFVGNVLFDLITGAPSIAIHGFAQAVANISSYVIYAAALTVGIIWSQFSKRDPRPEDGIWRYDVMPRAKVILFFCLLMVFDDSSGVVPVGERITYFLSLFGVSS